MNIALCGAGTMGRGIALNALRCGHHVVIYDINTDATTKARAWVIDQLGKAEEKGLLTPEARIAAEERFQVTTSLDDCSSAELVIEAVAEHLPIKHELFRALEERCSPTTILASNTSSISIAALARCLTHQDRFVGLHFFNPAHIMKLVEVIRGPRTTDAVVATAVAFAQGLGKVTVLARDVPGFIVNRVARNFYNEAQRIAMEQAATPEQIDRCMKAIGFKMGPFALMDLIGVDVNLDVTKSMYGQYFNEPRFTPSLMQQQYVDAGLHGKKSGAGFYPYES